MDKIDAKKIGGKYDGYSPVKEKTFFKGKNPASVLLRLKIISIVFIIVAAYLHFVINNTSKALILFSGGILAILISLIYSHLVKTGKIQYKDPRVWN